MVGNAPAGGSYTPPLLDFSVLKNLPQDYFQGTQNARTLQLQQAFKNGLPMDANGNPDISAMADQLSRIGGAPYAQQMLPYLIDARALNLAGTPTPAEGGLYGTPQQTPNGSVTSAPNPTQRSTQVPNAASSASITGNTRPTPTPVSQPSVPQPKLSTAGADDEGEATINTIAAETGTDIPSPLIQNVAKAMGVGLGDKLSEDEASRARAAFQNYTQLRAPGKSDVSGGGTPIHPVSGTAGNGSPIANGSETASPSTGIVPTPVKTIPIRPQVAQSTQTAQPATPQNTVGLAPGVPADFPGGNIAYAQRLQQAAREVHDQATRVSIAKPEMAKSLDAKAAAYEAQAKAIMDWVGKESETTPGQKEVNTNVAGKKITQETNARGSANKFAGVTGSADQYEREMEPAVKLSSGLLNSPDMYTGAGADINATIKKLMNAGFDSKAAQLQEVLQKITAASINTQMIRMRDAMNEAGGQSSNAGRIFQAQANLMEKASQSMGNTLEGNRALTEIQRRFGEQSKIIRDMAIDYLGPTDPNTGLGSRHQMLDPGFDKLVSKYLEDHPLYSPEEVANPKLLGVPTAPRAITDPGQRTAWGQGIGLNEGEVYRTPSGKYAKWHITIPLSPQNVR
jgi:hypothetical protein